MLDQRGDNLAKLGDWVLASDNFRWRLGKVLRETTL